MRLLKSYHPYAFITVTFWSLAYVFSRLAMVHFSPYPLGFLRYIVASAFLVIVVVAKKIMPPKLKDVPWFIFSGAAGFFIYMLTFNRGTELVPSATSSVIVATAPIMTALLARIFYGERLKIHQWAATGVEFCGILVLSLMGGQLTVNEGVIWLLLAALSLSVYNLLQKKMTKMYAPLSVTSYSIFFGTIMLFIFAPQAWTEVKTAPVNQYVNILVLGIFASALAYISWAQAFSKTKNTSSVSNYMFLTPFITAIFGFIFAGEVPDARTVVGGGIIMCGVLLFFKDNFFGQKS
ncbi:MAG: DMT family transporter [Firmicutes bacterium]|nr:DMT family transporter [Bacillota bacterium]